MIIYIDLRIFQWEIVRHIHRVHLHVKRILSHIILDVFQQGDNRFHRILIYIQFLVIWPHNITVAEQIPLHFSQGILKKRKLTQAKYVLIL